ncbi:MAG: hypothetical protein OQK66_01210 [Prosthecochloris sp.]|uniref:hypothetical protein n=2 Tax=Chlorobiaceae TaxID=191412 RepID=UPI00142E1382|nr:hypothetical protein [Prosthecochloris sp.]MCW8797566.1 hypothetical protein [Prosthecochloris sp.]
MEVTIAIPTFNQIYHILTQTNRQHAPLTSNGRISPMHQDRYTFDCQQQMQAARPCRKPFKEVLFPAKRNKAFSAQFFYCLIFPHFGHSFTSQTMVMIR